MEKKDMFIPDEKFDKDSFWEFAGSFYSYLCWLDEVKSLFDYEEKKGDNKDDK